MCSISLQITIFLFVARQWRSYFSIDNSSFPIWLSDSSNNSIISREQLFFFIFPKLKSIYSPSYNRFSLWFSQTKAAFYLSPDISGFFIYPQAIASCFASQTNLFLCFFRHELIFTSEAPSYIFPVSIFVSQLIAASFIYSQATVAFYFLLNKCSFISPTEDRFFCIFPLRYRRRFMSLHTTTPFFFLPWQCLYIISPQQAAFFYFFIYPQNERLSGPCGIVRMADFTFWYTILFCCWIKIFNISTTEITNIIMIRRLSTIRYSSMILFRMSPRSQLFRY